MTYPTLQRLVEAVRIPEPPVHMNEVSMEEFARQVVEFIEERCDPYLSQVADCLSYTNNKLFRGVTTKMRPRDILDVRSAQRTDREPKDVDPWYGDVINMRIKMQGGVANRTNSIFVTGDYHQAKDYGTPVVIFPLGKFDYTWSPDVEDLMLFIDEKRQEFLRTDTTDENEHDLDQDEGEHFINDALYGIKLQTDNLCSALYHGHEIMLRAENVLIMQKSFAESYIYPMMRFKHFNAERAWREWESGQHAV